MDDLASLIVPKHHPNWTVTMAECQALSDASFIPPALLRRRCRATAARVSYFALVTQVFNDGGSATEPRGATVLWRERRVSLQEWGGNFDAEGETHC